MQSENESRTNGLSLQDDNPNLALIEWANQFFLSDDSDNVNHSDHNPYNHAPSPPVTSPPPPPPAPPLPPPPQQSHSIRMTIDDKPRLRWTEELHNCFIECVHQLGGPFNATPKNITRRMKVDGLTILHVKSHLQKYRASKHPQSNELAPTPLPFQHDQSIPHETPAAQSTVLGTMMLSSQLPMQNSVQRSLQIQEGSQEKYLNSLKKRAYDFCAPQVTPRASFKHQKFETFNQAPLPNPSCIISAHGHIHSNEYEQQQSLEVVEEIQSQYLIPKSNNISTYLTTAGAHLGSSNCEDFSQVPFPTLPCITAEQIEMQSHSQQATTLLPAVEGYNLSFENAEIQTVLPSGSPLHNNQHGLCGEQVSSPRASFKHRNFETFNQAPLPNPSCIITAQSHMHSNEYEQQQSLEVVEEVQSQYLIQNISTDLTTAGAHLESSNCEDFRQVPFPTLPCITSEQNEMQSHSQQATTFLPAVEGYNLSSENAEIQTVLPSGSPLRNNQHGLCGITDWFSDSSPSDLWPGVEYCSFNELDPICFSTMPGGI